MIYLIAYSSGRTNPLDVQGALLQGVAQHGRCAPIIEGSAILIDTDLSALELGERALSVVDQNTPMLVTEMILNAAWHRLLVSDEAMQEWTPESIPQV